MKSWLTIADLGLTLCSAGIGILTYTVLRGFQHPVVDTLQWAAIWGYLLGTPVLGGLAWARRQHRTLNLVLLLLWGGFLLWTTMLHL